ncbi:MAG TPA: DUF2207 domain-containing protein [Polyangia bacterium]|nr:DUF2207 domain-containing protein [Polyangia bacterium]
MTPRLRSRRRSIFVLAALVTGALADARAFAEAERVVAFDADVTVNVDGSMRVVETIRVHGDGAKIDHGIYRDLPTRVRGFFNAYRSFDVLDVSRDGRPEPYTVVTRDDDTRVQIGDPSVHLGPGDFTYTLTYRTDGQLRFFADHDELYWNVTGNAWELAIDAASAVVHLPAGASAHLGAFEGYTGRSGSKEHALLTALRGGDATFTTARPLARREGLTIVLGWPPGFVRAPTDAARRATFWHDNGVLVGALVGVLFLLGYFLVAWWRVGRGPPAGPIVPRATPPEDLSPAALRYVRNMRSDDLTFAAALVSLADKGQVLIAPDRDGTYTVRRARADAASLPPEERAVTATLFRGAETVRLGGSNVGPAVKARRALDAALAETYRGRYFARHGHVVRGGVLVSLGVLVTLALSTRGAGRGLCAFLTLWLAFWSLGVTLLGKAVVGAWRKAARGDFRVGLTAGATFFTLFATPFFVGEVAVLVTYGATSSELAALLLALTLVIDALLILYLPAPTALGRSALDDAAGYAAFLTGGAAGRGAAVPAGAFGYAVALGVVDAWTRGLIATTDTVRSSPPLLWNDPVWSGTSYGTFASSFSAAVSSSSGTSGSGGGGSSGGGGGGGGGGGW